MAHQLSSIPFSTIAALLPVRCLENMQLVTGTVELYNAIRIELLPTPNKSHYTFNLRDLGKVVQGLMRADPKTLSTQQQVRWAKVVASDGCLLH